MPYEIPFKVGDQVTLKSREYTYKGVLQSDGDKLLGAVAIIERCFAGDGIVHVLWPPEITGNVALRAADSWCLKLANTGPTDEEIAEAFGLTGMPTQEEKPSDGHLKALHRIVVEGEWARKRLELHLGEDWRSHFEEN